MASFIIHTIAGEKFLHDLENAFNIILTDYDKKMFLLGNLIPDSLALETTIPENLSSIELTNYKIKLKDKIREEKRSTHFRNPENEELCLKIPDPDLFINKYQGLLNEDLSVLGYLFHLYTDRIFFSNLFPKTFINLDKNQKETKYNKESVYIKIKKNNLVVDSKEFWAGTSDFNIYNDYTAMNIMLLKLYGTSFNEKDFLEFAKIHFKNPGIEEVEYERIFEIIRKTQHFIEESYKTTQSELAVFTESDIIEFINQLSEQFIIEYKYIIERFNKIKKKTRSNI